MFLALAAGGGVFWVFFNEKAQTLLRESATVAAEAWHAAFRPGVSDMYASETILDGSVASSSDVAAEVASPTEDVPAAADDADRYDGSSEPAAASSDTVPSGQDAGQDVLISSVSSTEAIRRAEQETSPAMCDAMSRSAPSRKIILNEIAWMGSPALAGESASVAGSREWMELKNISPSPVDLFGWRVMNASRTIKIFFAEHRMVSPGGFALLARGNASTTAAHADQFYVGAMSNNGDSLFVFDGGCALSDMLDASNGWPAGENTAKRTLERDAIGFGWHTSASPGGTPGRENSIALAATTSMVMAQTQSRLLAANMSDTIVHAASATAAVATATASGAAALTNATTTGQGAAASSSWSAGASGTPVSSTISGCAGTVSGNGGETVSTSTTSASVAAAPDHHILIAEIVIDGSSSTNDFIKLFNPTPSSVDLGGWRLRKKTSTGSDQSIRVFPDGSAVLPDAYFTWANSAGGFSEAIGADVSSTATLAASNSVALFDASGTIVDAVAWGDGTNQYVDGASFPGNPGAGEVLARREEYGTFVDTDNNANDFVIR